MQMIMKYIVSQCFGEPTVAFVGVEDSEKDVAFVARLLHCHTVGFLKEVPCKVISAVFLKVCGIHIYRDTVIPGGIPAIIPVELFDRVQERLEKNKKAPAREKAEVNYLLTTKLYCGKCGAFMVGESGTSRTGVVHYYYKCVNAKRGKTCDKKTVRCIRGSKCKEGICKTSQNWPKQVFALSVIGERGTHEAAAEGECELSEGQDI